MRQSNASPSMTIFLYHSWAPMAAPVNSNRFNVHLPASAFPRSRACRRSAPKRIGFLHRHGQHRIGPQLVVILQIPIAQAEAVDPLPPFTLLL